MSVGKRREAGGVQPGEGNDKEADENYFSDSCEDVVFLGIRSDPWVKTMQKLISASLKNFLKMGASSGIDSLCR